MPNTLHTAQYIYIYGIQSLPYNYRHYTTRSLYPEHEHTDTFTQLTHTRQHCDRVCMCYYYECTSLTPDIAVNGKLQDTLDNERNRGNNGMINFMYYRQLRKISLQFNERKKTKGKRKTNL